jgi:hypothetical protein
VELSNRRQRGSDSTGHPIVAFWEWWSGDGRAIDPHQPSRAADELSRRVAAIHPDLTWHFGAGKAAEHRLTVSAGGVAQVRPSAERWLRSAPAPDETWEFRSSQEAEPDALSSVLSIAGREVDLSQTRFRVDPVEAELRVHVGVYHPAFEQMSHDLRAQVTYLVLDWVLGEDDVERWLGHIEPLVAAATSPVEDLTAAVGSLARSVEPGQWTLAQWQDKDGLPGLASFRRGVRWIDYPMLDKHHLLTRDFQSQDNGMPADGSTLDALGEIESELNSVLGSRGLLVGYQTHAGVRTFHVYADGEDQNVDSALRDFAAAHGLTLTSSMDPSWTEVRHLTG